MTILNCSMSYGGSYVQLVQQNKPKVDLVVPTVREIDANVECTDVSYMSHTLLGKVAVKRPVNVCNFGRIGTRHFASTARCT